MTAAKSMPRSTGRNAHDGHGAAAGKYATSGVPIKHKAPRAKLSFRKLLHLAHRFAVFLCALVYVGQCFVASFTAVSLLRGYDNANFHDESSTFRAMGAYAGDGAIRDSKLFYNDILQGKTTPVADGAMYLEDGKLSMTPCTDLVGPQVMIYEASFLRTIYQSIFNDASQDVAFLNASRLVIPVVDCSTSDITDGDTTTARFFFLVHRRSNASMAMMIVVSMSNQPYRILGQNMRGPAGIATLQHIYDMQQPKVLDTRYLVSRGYPFDDVSFRVYDYINTTSDGQWLLASKPRSEDEIPFILETSKQDGFFIKAASEQSNLLYNTWTVETNPREALETWKWVFKPLVHDSWAWIHAVLFYIGLTVLANLFILCLATTQNFLAGKWWIGDAFVSITTAQIVNGVLVGIAWFMNEYWVLHEFCFGIGYELSGVTQIRVYESVMRAHMFTLYMSASGLIGQVLQERIDPLLVTVCFHLGFELRLQIHSFLPGLRKDIEEYAKFAYMKSMDMSSTSGVAHSAMGYWSPHPIGQRNYGYVFQCLFPIYITLVLVVIYTIVRKIYHRFHPDSAHVQKTSTATAQSTNEATFTGQKRVLTLFEVATGAELENRFGLVSDYETCIFIKGMKFASADGIYSTGFVIANKKYLLQTSDYWSIVLMKLLRRRFRNIYVYDVNGSTVQQTARLVYPHTLTVQDLTNINVSVLS